MYIFEILEQRCYEKGHEALGLTFDEIVEIGGESIFDFDYGIYNDNYKRVLEEKFFLRNYEKQIGYETIFGFKRALRSKLSEVIPKYNKLYELDEKKIDYFIGQTIKEELSKKKDEEEDLTSDEKASRQRDLDRELESDKDFDTEGGNKSEECNKTSDAVTSKNEQNNDSIDDGKTKDNTIYKDRPENSAADNIKYATNTTSNSGTSYNDHKQTVVDNGETISRGTHGRMVAEADFKKSKTKTDTTEGEKEKASSTRDYDRLTKTSSLEEYIMSRTNNNADGMIDRVVNYIKKIKDTDELVLNELDTLFSSIWGW